jgi:hypothetical protein
LGFGLGLGVGGEQPSRALNSFFIWFYLVISGMVWTVWYGTKYNGMGNGCNLCEDGALRPPSQSLIDCGGSRICRIAVLAVMEVLAVFASNLTLKPALPQEHTVFPRWDIKAHERTHNHQCFATSASASAVDGIRQDGNIDESQETCLDSTRHNLLVQIHRSSLVHQLPSSRGKGLRHPP